MCQNSKNSFVPFSLGHSDTNSWILPKKWVLFNLNVKFWIWPKIWKLAYRSNFEILEQYLDVLQILYQCVDLTEASGLPICVLVSSDFFQVICPPHGWWQKIVLSWSSQSFFVVWSRPRWYGGDIKKKVWSDLVLIWTRPCHKSGVLSNLQPNWNCRHKNRKKSRREQCQELTKSNYTRHYRFGMHFCRLLGCLAFFKLPRTW